MRERADGSPVISHAQSLPSKHPAAIGVLARLGMASSCTLGMKAAGLGRGMTGMLGMRGDSGRMAHPSGAAMEASLGGRKGETKSLEAVWWVCRTGRFYFTT